MGVGRDARFMRRAIALSRRGFPAPNPRVGCVLVSGEEIVGEGYHDHAGGPHAEIEALRQAGNRARGAEMFVTLEPCAHWGRTPPCTQAILEAGVRRVVCAVRDPNPVAAGGLDVLRAAGVDVLAGVLEKEAYRQNFVFLEAFRRGRPFVVAKVASTLDGFVARPDGSSRWITGEPARRFGHRLRAEMGAVLVGRRTVELDDPRLTARIPGVVNPPLRVVLDPEGKIGSDTALLSEPGETLFVVREARRPDQWACPESEDGFELAELLAELHRRGVRGLLVEGGARTWRAFWDRGLLDRIILIVAPRVFGKGLSWTAGRLFSPEPKLYLVSRRPIGEDQALELDLEPRERCRSLLRWPESNRT